MYKSIVEIEQLLYRCCHAVDGGHLDRIVELFHPSASMIITWEQNGVYQGHDAIRGWFTIYNDTVIASMIYLHHKIASPSIEVNGDRAFAHSYLTVDSALKDTNQVIVTMGHYNDEFIKSEGSWFFQKKEIYIDNQYIIPPA